MRAAIITLERH